MEREASHRDWRIPIGGTLLALALAAALFAPALAPYDPKLSSGPPFLTPVPAHPLGTNDIGQDVLSQWLWGARAALAVAIPVAVLSVALSGSIGIAAALWRPAEGPLLALTDLLLALPSLPLYLLVVSLAGPGRRQVVLTLGLLSWPAFARVVRSQVLALRGQPYVEAARALGARPLHLVLVHVLPGTATLLPAKLVLTVRFALFAEATLAFLGLGDPAVPSWGTMLGLQRSAALRPRRLALVGGAARVRHRPGGAGDDLARRRHRSGRRSGACCYTARSGCGIERVRERSAWQPHCAGPSMT